MRHFLGDDPISTVCEIKTWYEIDGNSITHTAKLNLVTNEKNQDEIVSSNEVWIIPIGDRRRKKFNVPSWILLEVIQDLSTTPISSGGRKSHFSDFLFSRGLDTKILAILEKAIRLAMGISYYSASQFTNPGSCPISFEVEGDARRRTGISIAGHKKLLYDMYQEHRRESRVYLGNL